MFLTYQIAGSVAHVDLCFAELVFLPGWRLRSGYVVHRNGVLLHRLIANARPDQVVDHIDGNPLNNMVANLRVCTHAENMRNRKAHANNKLGIKGVYRDKNRWRAQIRANGQKHEPGSFKSPEEAHAAYKSAAVLLHGDFSRFN